MSSQVGATEHLSQQSQESTAQTPSAQGRAQEQTCSPSCVEHPGHTGARRQKPTSSLRTLRGMWLAHLGQGGAVATLPPPPSGANTGWRPRRAHQRAGVLASLPSAEQHRCLLNCCLERAPAVVCVCTPRLLCGNLPPIVVFGVPLEVLRSQGWSPMSGTSALKKGPRRACSLTPLLPPTLLSPAPEPWEVSGVMRKPRSPDFVTAVPVDRVASCPLPVSRKAWPQRLPVQLSHPYTLGNQCSSDKATTGAGPGSGLHQESCHVGRVWLH